MLCLAAVLLLHITPGLRFHYHDQAGSNWSPSLNTTWNFSPNWSVKAGASRAFKAPSLYQLDPNYIYYTRSNGCPASVPTDQRGCYVLGNPELDHETSWTKELTFTYKDDTGLNAGLTYYRNDYDNRIGAGVERVGVVGVIADGIAADRSVFQWENQGEAIIEGLEGFVKVPVTDTVTWSTNMTGNIRSERKDNGEPLSLIPKYTMNSNVDWDITPRWNTNLGCPVFDQFNILSVPVQKFTSHSSEEILFFQKIFNFRNSLPDIMLTLAQQFVYHCLHVTSLELKPR